MYAIVLLVFAATVAVANVKAACPGSPDKCVDKTAFGQLSRTNANDFCVQAAIMYAKAAVCLDECTVADKSMYLGDIKTDVNNFCQKADNKCPNVVETYINQTKSFDNYYGRADLAKKIIATYNAAVTRNDTLCQWLYWGRNGQKLTSCSFNLLLDLQLLRDNRDIVLCLAICGSETVSSVAEQIEDNSACSSVIDSKVESDSDFSCDVAASSDAPQTCSSLERQAQSLEKNTAGCADAQRKYILPRLTTYAIANKFMGCKISNNGVVIQAPSGSMCNYTNVLNSCMFAKAIDGAINWFRLKDMLNGDLPVNTFCQFKETRSSLLSTCIQAMIPCSVPQARLLSKELTCTEDYNLKIGVLPLNCWGMNTIWTVSEEICKKPPASWWTTAICQPQPLEVVTVPRQTQMRTTPSTQPPVKNQNSGRGQNDADAGNYQQLTDEGINIVGPVVLITISTLLALFTTM